MRRIGKLPPFVALAAIVIAAPLAAQSQAQPVAAASACTPATDVEAIVDDSGSMQITDPNRLRVQALRLLIDTLGANTSLGAVEFGSGLLETPGADTVFKPEPVGPNATSMVAALDAAIHADNGATDYNAAFSASDADNPGADARIFLTDGGHDIGEYTNGHRVHAVPTYVIGFSPGIASGEDQQRLKQIASDTGGSYFPLQDSSQLQSVMNNVEAALTCQTPPRQFTDKLAKGQSKLHSVAIGAGTKSLQITLSWASPLDKFKISGLKLLSHGRLVGIAGRPQKPRKLKLTRQSSTTFTVLGVTGLSQGRLAFKVSAVKIGSGAPAVSLITQVGGGGSAK